MRFPAVVLVFALTAGASAAMSSTDALARCKVPNCWGAIAISTENGAWSYVFNHPSKAVAKRRANRKCRGRCNRVLTFRNACGAYAVARNGGWGWGAGYSSAAGARGRAMRECIKRNRGQGCRVKVWACTSRYLKGEAKGS